MNTIFQVWIACTCMETKREIAVRLSSFEVKATVDVNNLSLIRHINNNLHG